MAPMDEFEVDEVIRQVVLASNAALALAVPPQATAAELRARADARDRSRSDRTHVGGFRRWLR